MKATLIQMNIAWADPAANRKAAESALLSAGKSDLYVLPEMWSTGFATDPKAVAEEEQSSSSLAWMQQMARRLDAAIAGSIAIHATDGSYRNRMYFVKPDGEVACYDKHHLFTYGNEHLHYTPGSDRVIVRWHGMRFLLQVCYDLRFPVFARNRKDYDCAIYIASWPTSRIRVWHTLLQARALENQCYVLGVNRVGTDPAFPYCGGTEAVSPYGKVIAVCPDGEAGTVTVETDMAALTAFRRKFPVLEDAD